MAAKPRGRLIHGWIVLDKPLGMSSAQAVAAVRRVLDAAKAGHGGTLDPLATGVLPIALGEATKTVAWAMAGRKTYRFTLRWGEARDSDDAALKVAGERAYARARAGESLDLAARPVEIRDLRLLRLVDGDHAEFAAEVGKGTYIRALARDLGLALGTLAHITALQRLAVGRFRLEDAISLEKLAALGHSAGAFRHLLPVETALDDIPALALTEAEAHRLRCGQAVTPLRPEDRARIDQLGDGTTVCATIGGKPVALTEVIAGGLRPVRVLNL